MTKSKGPRAFWSVVALMIGAASVVLAAEARVPTGLLSDVDDVVTWSARFPRQPGSFGVLIRLPGDPCARVECHEYTLNVALPAHTWSRPGGLQVGIHWKYVSAGLRDADLIVYRPDGTLVATSAGGDEDTESVFIPRARNGNYRIVVVQGTRDAVDYVGRAEVEFLPHELPTRDLLPNLQVMPQRDLVLGQTGAGPFGSVLIGGCLPEEIVELGARRCLRFEQIILNRGDGPMELRYDLSDIATSREMTQTIYRSDGTRRHRHADQYVFHPTHAHFHYEGFALSRLWLSNAAGERLGGNPIRTGRKNGFCLIDVENVMFDHKGDAARGYYGDGCAIENAIAGESLTLGISVGWGDVYNWFLPDQYIEVSGLRDNFYILETIADPDATVLETNEGDNATTVQFRICGDVAEIVGRGPSRCD